MSRAPSRPTCKPSALALFAALAASCAPSQAGPGPLNEYGNPASVPLRPTAPAITVADLQTRLYAFAHDSMMGRMRGREGNMKGNDYIARELARMGLEPAGDDGTYFQGLPFEHRRFTNASTLVVDGVALAWQDDFVPVPGAAAPLPIDSVQVIYGGVFGDTERQITPAQAEGMLVVFTPGGGQPTGRGGGGGGGGGMQQQFASAAAIATIDLHNLGPSARALLNNPAAAMVNPDAPPPTAQAAVLRITPEGAAKLFGGRPVTELEPGALGGTVVAELDFMARPTPEYARNVVAILRGSDPTLAAEYVALGAHNDHTGFNTSPVDHDSARAYAKAGLQLQISGNELVTPDFAAMAALQIDVDSIRRLRPARLDSINNGADDDGSGSMALLEIAESLAAAPVKPRRSVLFVWHTAEEGGLNGSRWFVDNPTVPREAIVAMLNLDMIGRGRADDVPGGGDDLLFVIGSFRDSDELGELVATVNDRQQRPLALDYRLDEPTEWPGYNNLYGRSDHINYARVGIPIAFFFTGLHHDYHRVTDEPQYIHYPKLERITRYVQEVAVEIANRERRPALNAPVPQP